MITFKCRRIRCLNEFQAIGKWSPCNRAFTTTGNKRGKIVRCPKCGSADICKK